MSRWETYQFGGSSWENIPEGPGCYAVFLDGKLGYIGNSMTLRKRIGGGKGSGAHKILPDDSGGASTPWGEYKDLFVKIRRPRILGEEAMVEARLIQRLKPPFNRAGLKRKTPERIPKERKIPILRKNRPPAFLFYAKDWLDWKVLRMSDAAQGVYIRLLAFMWKDSPDQCSVPNDDRQIARVLGKDIRTWRNLRAEIQFSGDPLFEEDEDRLVSHRLYKEKNNQEIRRKRLAEAGKKGAHQRWRPANDGIGDANGDANGLAMATGMAKGKQAMPRLSVSASVPSSDPDPEPDPKKDPVSPPASSEDETPKKLPKNPPLTQAQIVTFVNSWNVMARTAGLSECLLPLTESRKKKLRSRRCDPLFRDKWPEVLRRIGASTFCRGRAGSRTQGAAPWKASFDWAIHSEENFRKVLEGKYDDDENAGRSEPKRPYERPHDFAS